jgi:hypothetical protein
MELLLHVCSIVDNDVVNSPHGSAGLDDVVKDIHKDRLKNFQTELQRNKNLVFNKIV